MKGKVYIVGAGPGDPELLTIKGLRALEKSDVILYDALVSQKIFSLFDSSNKELVYVGKRKGDGDGELRQREINELMKKYVDEGKVVARLKGGDPGIFGRLADEISFLRENRIEFEVIPGVSSLNGVSTSMALPLTKKGVHSIIVLSGKENIDIGDLLKGTFVIMMGRDRIGKISESLISMGVSEETDVVAIENGTLENQKVVRGKLKDIHEKIEDFKGPTIIIAGPAVSDLP